MQVAAVRNHPRLIQVITFLRAHRAWIQERRSLRTNGDVGVQPAAAVIECRCKIQ